MTKRDVDKCVDRAELIEFRRRFPLVTQEDVASQLDISHSALSKAEKHVHTAGREGNPLPASTSWSAYRDALVHLKRQEMEKRGDSPQQIEAQIAPWVGVAA